MEFLLSVALVVLAVSHFSLRSRVHRLEIRELDVREQTKHEPAGHTHSTPPFTPITSSVVPPTLAGFSPATTRSRGDKTTVVPVDIERPPVATTASLTMTSSQPAVVSGSNEFFLYQWFKEQTLIKVGAIIFFLGALWFVSYAIEQNWISPLTRIGLGLLGSLVVYGIGYWRAAINQLQYQVLTVLGTGIVLGTITASQFAFNTPVIPASLAFLLMVSGVAYTVFVAVRTKSEWLAIAAAVTGLLVPQLLSVVEPNIPLLLGYLFCLNATLLLVGFVVTWHRVSLVLAIGVFLYTSKLLDIAQDALLWIFVCFSAAMLVVSVSVAIARVGRPQMIDVSTLALTLLFFLVSAESIAFSTVVAQFGAALVMAVIALWFRNRQTHVDAVSLYALISTSLLFVATSDLFSGSLLTIIFAVEALLIFITSCYMATVRRTVYVAAATFLIPLMSGLHDLSVADWSDGIWQEGALYSGVVVIVVLGGAIVWLLEQVVLRQLHWIQTVAGVLLTSWILFVWLVSATISEQFGWFDSTAAFVSLVTSVTLAVSVYVGLRVPVSSWRSRILLAWLVPLFGGLALLDSPAWDTGVAHEVFVVTLGLVLALGYMMFLYVYLSRQLRLHEQDATNAYVVLWVTLGYLSLWLPAIWYALLPDASAAVLQYLSYFGVLCLVVCGMLWLRVRFAWIAWIIGAGSIPLILSLGSYDFDGWTEGWLALEAVGIYISTTIILLLATILTTYRCPAAESKVVASTTKVLYWIGGIQLFLLVWMIAHSAMVSSATAVTVTLFIYTVAGLAAYSYGRTTAHPHWKRVGVLLLGAVVLRLGLIDVWSMEVLWRITTFLGIGTLFIVTALLERSKNSSDV